MTKESQGNEWGPEHHRRTQLQAWAKETPGRRFAWLEEMLDWLRRREQALKKQRP